MPAQTHLPPSTVARIKQLISEGRLQHYIARECSTTQPVISLIKSGRRYSAIPWPNGKIGSYKQAYPDPAPEQNQNAPGDLLAVPKPGKSLKERTGVAGFNWCPDALAYAEFSDAARLGMLEAVNNERASHGIDPLPDVSVEWEIFIDNQAPAELSPEEQEKRALRAYQAEDRRRALIYRSFQDLIDAQLQEAATKKLNTMLLTVPPPAQDPPPAPGALDPSQYQTADWEWVKRTARTHILVREAQTDRNPALCEAICIAFAQLPKHQWPRQEALEVIRSIEQEVLQSPAALAAGQSKLGAP
jgi:hypothetical protein